MRWGLWLARIAAITALILLILSRRGEYTIIADLATDPGPGGANIAYVGLGPAVGDADLVCPIGIENLEAGRVGIIDRDTNRVLSLDLKTRSVTSAREFQIDPRFYVDGAVYENKVLWLWVQDSPGELHVALPLPSGGDGPFTMDGTVGPERFERSELSDLLWRAASPEVQRRLEALGFPVPGVGRTPTLTRPEPKSWSDSITGPTVAAASTAPADTTTTTLPAPAPADSSAPAPDPAVPPSGGAAPADASTPPADAAPPPAAPADTSAPPVDAAPPSAAPADASAPPADAAPPPPATDPAVPPPPGPGFQTAAPAPGSGSGTGTYTLTYRLESPHRLTIGVAGPDGARQASVRHHHRIVFARVVRVDDRGDVFVLVTAENTTSRHIDVRQRVYRLPAGGGRAIAYDVPIDMSACVPKQHVVIAPSGEVLFLRVTYENVSLLQLHKRSWLSWFADPWPLPQLGSTVLRKAQALLHEIGSAAQAMVVVRNGEPIARREVVANACKIINLEWDKPEKPTGAPAADVKLCACGQAGDGACNWKIPSSNSHKLDTAASGTPFRGMTYTWGGFDTIAHFTAKIEKTGGQARPPGDVCTRYSPDQAAYDAMSKAARKTWCGSETAPRTSCSISKTPLFEPPNYADHVNATFAAGVDCSGFVMRSWGSNQGSLGKLSTKDLDLDAKRQRKIPMPGNTTRPQTDADAVVDFIKNAAGEDIATFSKGIVSRLKPGDIMNKRSDHTRMFANWWKKNDPTKWEIMESSVTCGGTCSRVLEDHELVGLERYTPMRLRWIKDELMTSRGDPRDVPELTEADLPMCHTGP